MKTEDWGGIYDQPHEKSCGVPKSVKWGREKSEKSSCLRWLFRNCQEVLERNIRLFENGLQKSGGSNLTPIPNRARISYSGDWVWYLY